MQHLTPSNLARISNLENIREEPLLSMDSAASCRLSLDRRHVGHAMSSIRDSSWPSVMLWPWSLAMSRQVNSRNVIECHDFDGLAMHILGVRHLLSSHADRVPRRLRVLRRMPHVLCALRFDCHQCHRGSSIICSDCSLVQILLLAFSFSFPFFPATDRSSRLRSYCIFV